MQFQPSDLSYGIWPFDAAAQAASSAYSTVTSWIADDVVSAQAKTGLVSATSDVYNQLDPRMTRAPDSLTVAYEQAIYFIAIAAQRADNENEEEANATLLVALARLEAEKGAASERIGLACSATGYFCPKRGSADVLQGAIESIEASGINAEDQSRLTAFLRRNAKAVRTRQAAPVLIALGLGAVAGTWWYRSRRRV